MKIEADVVISPAYQKFRKEARTAGKLEDFPALELLKDGFIEVKLVLVIENVGINLVIHASQGGVERWHDI